MKSPSWAGLSGQFDFGESEIRFKGSSLQMGEGPTAAAWGLAICDKEFGGGEVAMLIQFTELKGDTYGHICFEYDPASKGFLTAGVGSPVQYIIQENDGNRFKFIAALGSPDALRAKHWYSIRVRVLGSIATLIVDGVEVTSVPLPRPLRVTQVGVWLRGEADVLIRDFSVITEQPRSFVVMQFTAPYNELFEEVIRPVCDEFGVQAVRADDIYAPGAIIADIARQIDEARFVIAEITPANPNVYYEVGYSHARSKPTILIADRKLERLPFDISPFRTLFYDNSIDGKRRIEEGLRRHIEAIVGRSGHVDSRSGTSQMTR